MDECPRCSSNQSIRSGHVRGRQRFECKTCGYHFVASPAGTMPLGARLLAVQLYSAGLPMRQIARVLGVSSTTVLRWLRRFSKIYGERLIPHGRATVVPSDEVATSRSGDGFPPRGALTLQLQAPWLKGKTAVVARLDDPGD